MEATAKKSVFQQRWFWVFAITIFIVGLTTLIYFSLDYDDTPVSATQLQQISAIVSSNSGDYSVQRAYIRYTGTLVVWVTPKYEPKTHDEVSLWTGRFAKSLVEWYGYDADIDVIAMKPIVGSDKVAVYGTSSFRSDTMNIAYKAAK